MTGAEIRAWFEDWQQQVRAEGERVVLVRQLRARFGELPASAVDRVEAADVGQIERWVDRVLDAETLDAVLREAV